LVEGRPFLHGPVRSGNCTACHDAHGSGHAALLRRDFPKAFYASFDLENYALCFDCHDKALVLTEKTTALTEFRDGARNLHYLHVNRAEKGRTCTACHDIHGSDQPKHMAAAVPFEGSPWALPIQFEKTAGGGRCAPGCHAPKSYQRDQPGVPATAPAAAGGLP
jgi:predicted CXXCH cytochrome family protein